MTTEISVTYGSEKVNILIFDSVDIFHGISVTMLCVQWKTCFKTIYNGDKRIHHGAKNNYVYTFLYTIPSI